MRNRFWENYVNQDIPTTDLKSPFYMREVNRYKNRYNKYPSYFITELTECCKCGGHFGEQHFYSLKKNSYANSNYPNICNYCHFDSYFRSIAKSNILQKTGLRAKDQPKELVDAEILIKKTNFILNDKKHYINKKYILK